MRVLNVRNAHDALPRALKLLEQEGQLRESRNGPVLYLGPVTVHYEQPLERVIFWPERDANPFFHLYESLWMLAGRNDVAPLARYVKKNLDYSDNGVTLHGAYGYRWRKHFLAGTKDQLKIIASRLQGDPTDRRCVLQMWDAEEDLHTNQEIEYIRPKVGKDFPCNTIATFQRGIEGELNLTVFNRSNDLVFGMLGANCVQFGTLLEYMANWIQCPVGYYEQVTVNLHGYLDNIKGTENIRPDHMDFVYNPYQEDGICNVPMTGSQEYIDTAIVELLKTADDGFPSYTGPAIFQLSESWVHMVYLVLKAHHLHKEKKTDQALALLSLGDQRADWIVAAREWLLRRLK